MADNTNISDADSDVLTKEEIELVKEYRTANNIVTDAPVAFHVAEAKSWKEKQDKEKESKDKDPKKLEISDQKDGEEKVNDNNGDWRDNYIDAYGANKEDKECTAQKREDGGLTITDHETTVDMPSAGKVVMTAKDKDGKPMVPPMDKFDKQIAGAIKDGVEVVAISEHASPEFKARIMAACIKTGMKMENAPEMTEEFMSQISPETKEAIAKAQEEAKKGAQEKTQAPEMKQTPEREAELKARIEAARAKINADPTKKAERAQIEQARAKQKDYKEKGVEKTDKDYVANYALIKARGEKLYGGK